MNVRNGIANRSIWVLLVAGIGIVGVGMMVLWWRGNPVEAPQRLASQPTTVRGYVDGVRKELRRLESQVADEEARAGRAQINAEVGRKYFELGDYEEARRFLNLSVSQRPGILNQAYLGAVLCRSGEHAKAAAFYDSARKMAHAIHDRKQATHVAVLYASECARSSASPSIVRASLAELAAVEDSADNGVLFAVRGKLNWLLHNDTEAVDDFERALGLGLDPLEQHAVLRDYGISLMRMARTENEPALLDDAARRVEEAAALYPDDATTLHLLADVEKTRQHYDKARKHYRDVMRVKPGLMVAEYGVLTTFCLEKNCADAEDLWSEYEIRLRNTAPGLHGTIVEYMKGDEDMRYCRQYCEGF